MCGETAALLAPPYTVALNSTDRTQGTANAYSVRFPGQLKPGLYRCAVSVVLPTTDSVSVLDLRASGLSGLNLISTVSLRKGYVPVLCYTDSIKGEGVFILDARHSPPPEVEVVHSTQATGAARTDTEEHIVRIVMIPV